MKPPDQQETPEKSSESLHDLLKLILWFALGLTFAALLVIVVMFGFFHAHF